MGAPFILYIERMVTLEIKLRVEGKEKVFTVPFVSARLLRRTVEINKDHDLNDMDIAAFDAAADYISEVFGGQFSRDDVYDGLSSHQFIPTFLYIQKNVFREASEAAGGGEPDPNVRARA